MRFAIHHLEQFYFQSAFDLATRVFSDGSSLHLALGVGLDEYRRYLHPAFESMVDEGLSVVAVDETTGELSGCLIVTDFSFQAVETVNQQSEFAPLSALTAELFRQYSRQTSVMAGEVILVDMAAVSEHARGSGLYQKMRSEAHKIAREKGFNKVAGELSSASTQRFVLDKLGHEIVAEVALKDFEFEGRHPYASITVPNSIILAVGEL